MSDIFGDWNRDVLRGTDEGDRIFGFSGRDRLYGLDGDDILVGGRGNDRLYGGEGSDLLHGGTGSDLLRGGAGSDTLVGGRGHDVLYGGDGADTFRFDDRDAGDFSAGRADEIRDFGAGDILDLTRVNLLYHDGGLEPRRGGFSSWSFNGDTYVGWNTFNAFHDIVLRGYTGDILSQIRWYDDDFSEGTDTEGNIAAGEIRSGRIEVSQDTDWFKIDLTKGQAYTFDLKGDSGQSGLPDPFLSLIDPTGVHVATGGGGTLDARIVFAAEESGTYYLEATTANGNVGSYHLAAEGKTYVDDYAGDTSTTGEIAAGGTVHGDIATSYDEDWFRITLTEGQTYTFDLWGVELNQETLYPYLVLFDADGHSVADAESNPDGFTWLAYEATASGTFYVAVTDENGRTGTYTLSMASAASTAHDSGLLML